MVRVLNPRIVPISALLFPFATQVSTSVSLGVRPRFSLERYKGQKKDKKKQGIFEFLSSLVISNWIPFKVNAAVEGVLGLGDKLAGDPYTLDDQELLTTLANEGVLAIENAISHQEVVRYAASLEASLRQIQILDSIRSNLAKFVPKTVQDLIEQSPEAPLFDKRETDVPVLFADITGTLGLK